MEAMKAPIVEATVDRSLAQARVDQPAAGDDAVLTRREAGDHAVGSGWAGSPSQDEG